MSFRHTFLENIMSLIIVSIPVRDYDQHSDKIESIYNKFNNAYGFIDALESYSINVTIIDNAIHIVDYLNHLAREQLFPKEIYFLFKEY